MVGENVGGDHTKGFGTHSQPMSKDQLAKCQDWLAARVEYMRAHPITSIRPANPSKLENTPNV